MDETDILNKIRNRWTALHLIHIETNTTMGVPDVNFCYDGLDVWMELKILRGAQIYMEKFQPQFHLLRNMKGGKSLIFAANRDIIKVLRISHPQQAAKGIEVGKFKRFDVDDLDPIIEWGRPFDWKKMFIEFMEKLKCL